MTLYRNNPMLMTVMGANPGRQYQGNPPAYFIIDPETNRILGISRGHPMHSFKESMAKGQAIARRLGYEVIHVVHPYIPSGFKIGTEVSPLFYHYGANLIHPDGSMGPRMNSNPRHRRVHSGGSSAFVVIDSADGSVVFRKVCRAGDRRAPDEAHGQAQAASRLHSRPFYSEWDLSGQLKVGDKVSADKVDYLREVRESWRKAAVGGPNRNPGGLGAAVVGGIAGAVANRMMRSNPRHAVPADLNSALEAVLRWSGNWSAKPYAEALMFGNTGFDDVKATLLYLKSNLRSWKGPEAQAAKSVIDKYARQGLETFTNPARSTRAVHRVQQKRLGWAKPNPSSGLRGKKKVVMSIEKFAQLLKRKGDPKLWADFIKKVKGYQKWTHGTLPKKVTLECVDKPGMSGLWLTYDLGKSPETTYIMPGTSKRKGAWKHPWGQMPNMKGDPESGIIMTKLVSGNKITDFLHG